MNKFNLEKWKAGAKVCTRDGKPVESLTHFPNADDFQLVGVLDGQIDQWTDDGCYFARNDEPNGNDLVIAEPEMWVNVYSFGINERHVAATIFNSKEDALKTSELGKIGTYRLCES